MTLGSNFGVFTLYRDNPDAINDPTVDNDSSQGFVPGSRWYNSVSKVIYLCTDNTLGAAVWQQFSNVVTPLPTSDPNAPSDLWDNGGFVVVSQGSLAMNLIAGGGVGGSNGVDILMHAGNGDKISGTKGGSFYVYGGNNYGVGSYGGQIYFAGGTGLNSAGGGGIVFRGGPGYAGGDVVFSGGNSNGTVTDGGFIAFYSGDGGVSGGHIVLAPSAVPTPGNVYVRNLPSSDPGVTDALYYDPVTGIVKKSL